MCVGGGVGFDDTGSFLFLFLPQIMFAEAPDMPNVPVVYRLAEVRREPSRVVHSMVSSHM